ncbi:Xaa-Pro dipeptidase [Aliikangiella coralliicola]|uniref:Xaa-Pro dipeptidase n=1 Tax=Aliikangiella coralliicola TaxID=2592383 RepID=A0A545UG32_9GAMM|nr:Xaa-Pro dipeptidase [Aliikangiella coralliicola]TQV88429.1 Xaa-Pro dipeptidase [Aliikangiella coralliicola]
MSNLANLYGPHLTELLARHRQLMQQNDIAYLVIPSGEPIRIYLDDMDYPFKSSFLFRTYVPLTELPHSYLIIGHEGKPTLVYFQPEDYWHVAPSDPEGIWPEHFDVKVISSQNQASQFLPENSENVAVLGQPTDITSQLSKAQINPPQLLNSIYWQRAYKTDYEIACMKLANEKAAYAHKTAEEAFRAGKSEQQIHLAYVEATGMMEHQMPYSNIVALNNHGAVLHYTECDSVAPKQMKSFLIDAGVSVNGYHSDITRTYSFQKDEFADLIEAMDEMQRGCIDSIQTGQPYLDLHVAAHLKIAEIIQRFGLVDMSPESMLESGVSATFFPHGLGHLIGLQVHDVGGQFGDEMGTANPPPEAHPFLRSTRNMEPGVAFTIEPGLYFIESLLKRHRDSNHASAFNWDKIESFMPYGGIRIEDDIVVQDEGVLNLTRDAFAKL